MGPLGWCKTQGLLHCPLSMCVQGKGRVPGPEVRRGRTDLTDTFTQSILREPEEKLAQLMKKGGDPLADAWCAP